MDRQEQLTNPKEAIISLISNEMNLIKRRMNEVKAQMDQTQTVVNTQQQRTSDLATEIQNIKDNIDTVPRQDIVSKYDEALDARFRLATMRGQLDAFKAKYEFMETQQTFLSQVLSEFNQGEAWLDDEEEAPVDNKGQVNIVRIVQAQEDERKRLGLQMHDGPAQSLTNFILQAEICQRLFDRDPQRAAEELTSLKNAASITFQKVRDFIFDLRPMMLDDLGVVPTVRRYVDSFREKTDIETDLEITGDERRLENHREVMVFRGIQDLMAHVRDYATANRLKVRLDMGNAAIRMVVEDNGRGFNPEVIFSGEEQNLEPRVQGLITLKERFELVGGSMTVSSDEGIGTSVRLELPSGEF